MLRKIIRIDEEKCNGCGICADACHEGAIEIADGKARLAREDFCDGFGDCLPGCPQGAISFEEREAPAYDSAAVAAAKAGIKIPAGGFACPGSAAARLGGFAGSEPEPFAAPQKPVSRLAQWPCQIKLVPVKADFFDGCKLLIAADCTAYTYAGMHEDFMKGSVTLIGCPKLDNVDYSEKLTAIIAENDVKSVTLVRMDVPCCGGLQRAVETALKASGKFIPWHVVTVFRDGRIQED